MKAVITDVRILEVSGSTVHIEIVTDVGSVQILTECERIERRLVPTDTHIEGLHPGALGRSGLNAIAGKLKEIVDVDTLEIHGAIRTTGQSRPASKAHHHLTCISWLAALRPSIARCRSHWY